MLGKLGVHGTTRYLPDLEVNDEGGYWETGDIPELERRREVLNARIAELAGELAKMDLGGKAPETVADEIEAFFEGRGMGDQ